MGGSKAAEFFSGRATAAAQGTEPVSRPPPAPFGRLSGAAAGRVPANAHWKRENAPRRYEHLSQCPLAGGILAAVVGCDHPPHSRSGFPANQTTVGGRSIRLSSCCY